MGKSLAALTAAESAKLVDLLERATGVRVPVPTNGKRAEWLADLYRAIGPAHAELVKFNQQRRESCRQYA